MENLTTLNTNFDSLSTTELKVLSNKIAVEINNRESNAWDELCKHIQAYLNVGYCIHVFNQDCDESLITADSDFSTVGRIGGI